MRGNCLSQCKFKILECRVGGENMDRQEELLYWLWLCNMEGIGHRTIDMLLGQYKHPRQLYQAKESELSCWLKGRKLTQFLKSRDMDRIKRLMERLAKQNVRFLHRQHEDYPNSLSHLEDAPFGIYVRGALPPKGARSIAIVGARQADEYGCSVASYFARELSNKGICVISGLAYGVDSAAHKGAIEASGYTLGILGCGINICYPKENASLFRAVEKQGGILSEYGLNVPPKAGLFPLRNRLIAAMADGILVTQARERSGSLITVDQGLEQGKDIFSVPGRIGDALSEGCNSLIQSGAKLVTGVWDILEEWGWEKKIEQKILNHSDITLVNIEKMVYSVLGFEAKYIDIIIEETGLSVAQLLPVLIELEQRKLIRQPRPNYYCVCV